MISVFIADDHTIIREGLAELLARHPDLSVVGTGAEGRESLQRILALRPDVAVIDISMAGMNGLEVADQLCSATPPVAVVILSMHASPEFVFRALEVGAKGYVQKESAAGEIVDAIRTVHGGRRYLSANIARMVAGGLPGAGAGNPLGLLSRREREILQLVAEGRSSAWIGRTIHLSPKTIDTYRSRLMHKLDLPDVTALVKFALQHGMITLD
jgi:DNA-binding NarL/FixJ family response regulator